MFEICTDTSANLPYEYIQQNNLAIAAFPYSDGSTVYTCKNANDFDGKNFYNSMRSGTRISTSQINPQSYIDVWEPLLSEGKDVIYIGMSSGISGTFASCRIAALELAEKYPERSLLCVDTLGASLGEGLLVMRAVDMRKSGAGIEQTYEELMKLRHSMCQVFTVDDLKYLRNTGRLSNAVAFIAAALNIKPILKGNTEGKIVSFAKHRGRKHAIKALAEEYARHVRDADKQIVGIAHADCPEDAERLIRLLNEKQPPADILCVCYEPVTGSHVGPGTLALFFLGDEEFRKE